MTNLPKHLQETAIFEPLLIDALERNNKGITEQHSRILATIFRLGGYTTLNVLTDIVKFAQPTVSQRVQELVDLGYIRKNSELLPATLVLLLNASILQEGLTKRFIRQHNAINFLKRVIEEDIPLDKVKDTMFQAFELLFPQNKDFAELIAYSYLNPFVSRNELIFLVDPDKTKPKNHYDEIFTSHPDYFQIIYKKQKKRDMYIQPKLTIKELLEYRQSYFNMLQDRYSTLIQELERYLSFEYESIIPHKYLNFLSEIKTKINVCLKYYSNIRIINNSILVQKFHNSELIDLIIKSPNFDRRHALRILTTKEIKVSDEINQQQIEISQLNESVPGDYLIRDFVIFENHGCLVIPANARSIPYYNIGPTFISNIKELFDTNWG